MKTLLSMVGDGDGETSTMRVIVILMALSVIVPHIFLSIKLGVSQPWTADDLTILGMALTAKVIQNKQESKPTTDKEVSSESVVKQIST